MRLPLWRRYLLEVLILVAAYLVISGWQRSGLLDQGSLAPDLDARTSEGTRLRLADLHGKRVLLHFWATWCGVCRSEFGALNALAKSLSPDEALVTVVADGEDPERIRAFVREHQLSYPVLLASEGLIAQYRVRAFPTNYFVDAEGRIRDATVGMSSRWTMSARLGCSR